jgi:hypothetical protein
MARIWHLEAREAQRPTRRTEVDGTNSVVEGNGEQILQIDTYGTAGQKIPGKISQSLQFDSHGILALRQILAQFG